MGGNTVDPKARSAESPDRDSPGLDRMSSEEWRETTDTLDHSLRSARGTLLAINLISAFLFLTIFEMILGWQMFRPSASERIFCERLADIATYHRETCRTPAEKALVDLGASFAMQILQDAGNDSTTVSRDAPAFRAPLQNALSKEPTWAREDYLRSFAKDTEKVLAAVADSLKAQVMPADSSARNATLVLTVIADSLFAKHPLGSVVRAAAPKALSGASYACSASVRSLTLAFALSEIEDRARVNDETKGRRVSPRIQSFPIIGKAMQVEDVTVPVAIFLLLLTYWMRTSLVRAYEAAYTLLRRPISRARLDRVIDRFQFIHQQEAGNNPGMHHGFVWLLLAPYLVVASSIVINFHELVLLDTRAHGSGYALGGDIARVFFTTQVMSVAAAIGLFWLGSKSYREFGQLFRSVRDGWQKLQHEPDDHREQEFTGLDSKRETPDLTSRRRALTSLVLVGPFVVFGTYSGLSYVTGDRSYFLSVPLAILYLLSLCMYVCALVAVTRHRVRPVASLFLCLVFFALPLVLALVMHNLAGTGSFDQSTQPALLKPSVPGVLACLAMPIVGAFLAIRRSLVFRDTH
jgi:hypothetical protein